MARPKYLLEDFFYDQSAEHMKKSPSGYSISGAMRQPGEEIEWDGSPAWCMKPVNSEAQAMFDRYPPEEPLHLDEMVENSGGGKDVNDSTIIKRPAMASRMLAEEELEEEAPIVASVEIKKKRGRPARIVTTALLALMLMSGIAHADINAGQANSVLTGQGFGNDPLYLTTPKLKGLAFLQGANGAVGTFTCTSGGTITISNTSVRINDFIGISLNTVGGTVGVLPAIQTITSSTGFTVVCSASDTSTYNYNIFHNGT